MTDPSTEIESLRQRIAALEMSLASALSRVDGPFPPVFLADEAAGAYQEQAFDGGTIVDFTDGRAESIVELTDAKLVMLQVRDGAECKYVPIHPGPGSTYSAKDVTTVAAMSITGQTLSVTPVTIHFNARGHELSKENATALTATIPGLPSGSSGQYLRHNGSAWVAASGVDITVITNVAISGTDIVFTTRSIKVLSDNGAGDPITLTGTDCA